MIINKCTGNGLTKRQKYSRVNTTEKETLEKLSIFPIFIFSTFLSLKMKGGGGFSQIKMFHFYSDLTYYLN